MYNNRALFLDNLTRFNRELLLGYARLPGEFRCGDLIILLRRVYDIEPFQAKLITAVIYPCPTDRRGVLQIARVLSSIICSRLSYKRSARFLTFEQIPIVLIAPALFRRSNAFIVGEAGGINSDLSPPFFFRRDRGSLTVSDKRLTALDRHSC